MSLFDLIEQGFCLLLLVIIKMFVWMVNSTELSKSIIDFILCCLQTQCQLLKIFTNRQLYLMTPYAQTLIYYNTFYRLPVLSFLFSIKMYRHIQ